MSKRTILLSIVAILINTGCMSTRVVVDKAWEPRMSPVYEDYFDYYFWGLSGHPDLKLQKVCMDQKILAMKRFKNPTDIFLTVITLGVYYPMTVQVWCGD